MTSDSCPAPIVWESPSEGDIPETAFSLELRKKAIDEEMARRIRMTCSCEDCSGIPKVEDAGRLQVSRGIQAQKMHNGVLVVADGYCGPWMTEIIRQLQGHHEPQEERVFHTIVESLDAPAAMVELGAYWSYYSLWFLARHPRARSIIVEPDPNHLEIAKSNFMLNNRNATMVQAAVGSASARAIPFRCESDGMSRTLPMVSVDDLVRQLQIESPIDILLADIQGAETSMLEGISSCIERKLLRYLFLSTHSHHISGDHRTHQRCLAFLQQLGAWIVAEHTVEESFSGDGLIVAAFPPAPRLCVDISFNRHKNSLFGSSEEIMGDVMETLEDLRSQVQLRRRPRRSFWKWPFRT